MPDRAEVEEALASLIATAAYPSGAESGSVFGADCRVYRGWPVPRVLEEELAAGVVHITVQPIAGSLRDRTRFTSEWQGSRPAPTLSCTIERDTVVFAGTGGVGHVAGVRVDGLSYAYRMRSGDSAGLVAAVLADQIRADRPAIAIGTTLLLAEGQGILARIVTDGLGGREIRRQSAGFRITFWCPDPLTRDSAVAAIDTTLAETLFMDVGGWACQLRISGDSSTDEGSAGGIWRRDLLYSVEYPTVTSETLSSMLFGIADVNDVPYVG